MWLLCKPLFKPRDCVSHSETSRSRVLFLTPPPDDVPIAMLGEFHAYRGLVLAAIGQLETAEAAFRDALGVFALCRRDSPEPPRRAVIAVQRRGDAHEAAAAVRTMVTQGYFRRGRHRVLRYPPLAVAASGDPALDRSLTQLFVASRDIALGRRAGLEMPRELRRNEGLSRREREVYELSLKGVRIARSRRPCLSASRPPRCMCDISSRSSVSTHEPRRLDNGRTWTPRLSLPIATACSSPFLDVVFLYDRLQSMNSGPLPRR